ncbi:MAG: MFS transporter [Clostridiales bacterium]|nr:MFS transporter [Clostridiales bacterium]
MFHSDNPNYKINYKLFIAYGIMFELMMRLYQPFQAKFLQRLGGSDVHIALMSSLPGLVMAFIVLPGAIYLNRLEDKHKATGRLILISRMFLLMFASVPFLPTNLQPILFVIFVVLMSVPNSIYFTSYQSFIGDLFEPAARADAIGKRNMFTVPATVILTFFTGLALKYLPGNEAERIQLYQMFYVIAFVFGVVEYFIFKKFKIPPLDSKKKKLTFNFKEFMNNKKFTRFLKSSLIFHFGWQMAWPLFTIYTISVLNADEAWLGYMSIGQSLAMFFGYLFWAKKINKYGNHVITAICTMGMALTPIFYILSPNLSILLLSATVSGFFTAGTISVLLSDLLEVIPQEKRVLYIGLYTVFTNVSLAISPLVGSYLKETFSITVALGAAAFFRMLGSVSFFKRSKKEHIEAMG